MPSPLRRASAEHPGGIVDLSIGSPVDPTPAVVADALRAATDAHAYPQTVGTARCARRSPPGTTAAAGFPVSADEVLPTVGSKELVALLPLLLDLGPGMSSCTRARPTRPTRSGRSSWVRCPSPPTIPPSGPRARAWSGSTRPATPTAACSTSTNCAQPSRVRVSSAPSRLRRVLRRTRLGRPWAHEPSRASSIRA
jgi:hypothetical protein